MATTTAAATTAPRLPRRWYKKPHWSVRCPDPDPAHAGGFVTKEYATLVAVAQEHGLSSDTLRHVVNNTKIGRMVKSERYRALEITKLAKTPGRVSKRDKCAGYAWCCAGEVAAA